MTARVAFLFALCVAGCSAFTGVAVSGRAAARAAPAMGAKPKAKAAPKKAPVKKPMPKRKPVAKPAPKRKPAANYDSIIGGFIESGGVYDPIGYAKGKDLNRLRSVEIKHGRVCMLATLGLVVQEVYSWPNSQGYFDGSNPLSTPATVPVFGLLQILLVVGLIEVQTGNEWQRGAAGDLGWDPLGLSKDGVNPKYAEAELKHGRLAMIAWLAFVTQSLVSGKGVLETTYAVFQ